MTDDTPSFKTFTDIDKQLVNEWEATLVSYPEPGVVRIQLADATWTYEGSHYEYGTTLEDAVQKAIEFSQSTTPAQWFGVPDWAEDDESWRHLGDDLITKPDKEMNDTNTKSQ